MPIPEHCVKSVEEFIRRVREIEISWNDDLPLHKRVLPWFRGESQDPNTDEGKYPLTPSLYRLEPDEEYDENWLLQTFRQEAPVLSLPLLPDTGRIDQWLFLARHVGLPTRLLDWTEGALIALYFALRKMKEESGTEKDESGPENEDREAVPPAVWMLNPFKLIQLEAPKDALPNIYPLTWVQPTQEVITDADTDPQTKFDVPSLKDPSKQRTATVQSHIYTIPVTRNIGISNIKAAWTPPGHPEETVYPVPIRPTYVHPRMIAQLSCFTIYGSDKHSMSDMLADANCLVKLIIDMEDKKARLAELRTLGIAYTNLMPDPDGLAEDIKNRYPPLPKRQ